MKKVIAYVFRRIGPHRLSGFQLVRSIKNSAAQFRWKSRSISFQYPVQQMRQNCGLIPEVINPLKNPNDSWVWQ